MFTREYAKKSLKRKGWNQRTAAQYLSRSYQHVCLVLNGRRESRSLLKALSNLPEKSKQKDSSK